MSHVCFLYPPNVVSSSNEEIKEATLFFFFFQSCSEGAQFNCVCKGTSDPVKSSCHMIDVDVFKMFHASHELRLCVVVYTRVSSLFMDLMSDLLLSMIYQCRVDSMFNYAASS